VSSSIIAKEVVIIRVLFLLFAFEGLKGCGGEAASPKAVRAYAARLCRSGKNGLVDFGDWLYSGSDPCQSDHLLLRRFRGWIPGRRIVSASRIRRTRPWPV
jgi:hypothetical protein